MPFAFVSYHREDSARADRLCAALEAQGIQTWMDRSRLEPGHNWPAIIVQRIHSADAFILCVSPFFWKRPQSFVHKELDIAVARLADMHPGADYYYPVLFAPTRIPDVEIATGRNLADYQVTDLTRDFDARAADLGRRLARGFADPARNMATLIVNNTSRFAGYFRIDDQPQGGKYAGSMTVSITPGRHELIHVDDDPDNERGYDRNFYSNRLIIDAAPRAVIVVSIRDPRKIGWFKKEVPETWIIEMISNMPG